MQHEHTWNVLGCMDAPLHTLSLDPGHVAPLSCGHAHLSWRAGHTTLSMSERLPQAAAARPTRVLNDADAGYENPSNSHVMS